MAFRNKELVDKGFTNIKTKVRTLDLMVSRGGSSVEDFRKILKSLYEKIEDLESLVEKEASPLRNG
jgi:alcohol dehydrogenase class IV|tara:strand:+ start:324 stop:521 length:198 start_codon:yes stop_codon:yes gene_type:complete